MASRRLWISALVVAIILIVASATYVILSKPEPTASDMILNADDLGHGWNGLIHNASTEELEQYGLKSGSGTDLFNQTFGISIGIEIYNSKTACQDEYDDYSEYFLGNHTIRDHILFGQNLTLGDRSLAGYWDSVEYPHNLVIIVQKGDILWIMSYTLRPLALQPWWKNATFAAAQLQDEKINEKLAWF